MTPYDPEAAEIRRAMARKNNGYTSPWVELANDVIDRIRCEWCGSSFCWFLQNATDADLSTFKFSRLLRCPRVSLKDAAHAPEKLAENIKENA